METYYFVRYRHRHDPTGVRDRYLLDDLTAGGGLLNARRFASEDVALGFLAARQVLSYAPSSDFEAADVVEARVSVLLDHEFLPDAPSPLPSKEPRRLDPGQVGLAEPRQDLIVVDGFYDEPALVRAFALSQQFQHNPAQHKGQRSRERFLFPGIKERFETLLGRPIKNWEEHGFNGVFQFCVEGEQLVIHSDHQNWAAVVYLTPDAPPDAGTTFYRSKATGLRYAPTEADAIRLGRTTSELERDTYGGKLLDPTHWDAVDVVGNVYNRLSLWNARMIHGASKYFGTGPADGRLFHMFFFD